MHGLLPNLVHSIGLSCGIDSDRFFFQKLSGCCNIFEVIPFAANNTALQQLENFCERNLFESIQNAHQALYTKSGSDYCNISKVIPFAANNTILQHFAENHHFLKKEPF